MTFYYFSDEQKNGSGDAESQDRQKGNNQYAFHGEPPFLFVPIFTNSLSLWNDKYNSAGILSFLWERHPTDLNLNAEKYYQHPIPCRMHWV